MRPNRVAKSLEFLPPGSHTTHRAGPQWAVQQVGSLDEVLRFLPVYPRALHHRSFTPSKPGSCNYPLDMAWLMQIAHQDGQRKAESQ
ncbi:hypothetical protein Cenrod_1216 [Candidatus Symbiobacter mobilis CR]|uniref:Uncharacterized protein n=1 Tax=Candidatus Symbiobacter mobilis CR TaxID=946483 RepID=U5NAL8_9BURK|nr:hypothetical protein Cenrod_1216 [Candidatus Symbiobacter mobilis CR]